MKAVRILATLALLLCATRLDAQQYFGMTRCSTSSSSGGHRDEHSRSLYPEERLSS